MPDKLTTDEQFKWLSEHIPHRIRSCFAITPQLHGLLANRFPDLRPPSQPADEPTKIRRRCETDAIWEGRIVALRWLIDFVGFNSGSPRDDDVTIEEFEHGRLFAQDESSDAKLLADVRSSAHKASAHATTERHHQNLADDGRNQAVMIIVKYLSETTYSDMPNWMDEFVLTSSS